MGKFLAVRPFQDLEVPEYANRQCLCHERRPDVYWSPVVILNNKTRLCNLTSTPPGCRNPAARRQHLPAVTRGLDPRQSLNAGLPKQVQHSVTHQSSATHDNSHRREYAWHDPPGGMNVISARQLRADKARRFYGKDRAYQSRYHQNNCPKRKSERTHTTSCSGTHFFAALNCKATLFCCPFNSPSEDFTHVWPDAGEGNFFWLSFGYWDMYSYQFP